MNKKIKINNIIIFLLFLTIGCLSINPLKVSTEEDIEVYSGGKSGSERPGTISIWSGNSGIPDGYLLCDGSTYTVDEYTELYEIIGSRYGGNGITTFKVPDLSGKIGVGENTSSEFATIGTTGGKTKEAITLAELPSHNHVFDGNSHTHTFIGTSVNSGNQSANHTHSLANHAHSVAAVSGTTSTNGAHTHTLPFHGNDTESAGYGASTSGGFGNRLIVYQNGYHDITSESGYHDHFVIIPAVTTGGNSATTTSAGAHTHTIKGTGTNDSATPGGTIASTGSSELHNNVQPYIVLKYIIKY